MLYTTFDINSSLINYDINRRYGFAHRSILEYLFVRSCLFKNVDLLQENILTDNMQLFRTEFESYKTEIIKNIINTSNTNSFYANLFLGGVSLHNLNLADYNFCESSLIGANLSATNLTNSNFSGANLSGANLFFTKFNKANLSQADLSSTKHFQTDFSNTDLSGANLTRADISGVDFRKTIIKNTIFSNAKLDNVKFNLTSIDGADFKNATFRDVSVFKAEPFSETLRFVGTIKEFPYTQPIYGYRRYSSFSDEMQNHIIQLLENAKNNFKCSSDTSE